MSYQISSRSLSHKGEPMISLKKPRMMLGSYIYIACSQLEDISYLFPNCSFAKEIWGWFDIPMGTHIHIFHVLTGHVPSLSRRLNFLWTIISTYVLWFIWLSGNDDIFKGRHRILTESLRRLTRHKIFVQVSLSYKVNRKKLKHQCM